MAKGIIASAGGQGRADGFGQCHRGRGRGWGRAGADAAVTEEATGRAAAGVFASAEKSARKAGGDNFADEAVREIESWGHSFG